MTQLQQPTWLGKSPTCRRHVGPTAKSRHFWPTRPSRADTNSFPTLFLCRGLPTFFKFSLSTRGTYGVIIVQTGMYKFKQSVQPGYFFSPSQRTKIFFSASIIEEQHLTTSAAAAWVEASHTPPPRIFCAISPIDVLHSSGFFCPAPPSW